jgi:hypothetical protein
LKRELGARYCCAGSVESLCALRVTCRRVMLEEEWIVDERERPGQKSGWW